MHQNINVTEKMSINDYFVSKLLLVINLIKKNSKCIPLNFEHATDITSKHQILIVISYFDFMSNCVCNKTCLTTRQFQFKYSAFCVKS